MMYDIIAPGAFDKHLPADLPLRINFEGEPIGTAHVEGDDVGGLRLTLTITDEGLREFFERGT